MPQTRIDISKAKLLFTCKLESDLRGDWLRSSGKTKRSTRWVFV